MDLYGFKGGGAVGVAISGAVLGFGFSASMGVSSIQDAVGSAISDFEQMLKTKNTEYWKELENIPNRLRLAKEHRGRSNSLTQIHDAYNIKVDSTEYINNRNYFSKVYSSMTTADIPHQDILSIYGNPYIGIVTRWSDLSDYRKKNLKLQYSEIERGADNVDEQKRSFYEIFNKNICDPAKRFLDEYGFAMSVTASVNPYGRAYSVVKGAIAVDPKMVKIITTINYLICRTRLPIPDLV